MGRFGFIAKRALQVVPLLLGIVLVVFLLLHVTPGDPVRQVVGLRASPEELDAVRAEMGLDDPIVTQYARYVGRLLHGDMGYSYKSSQPVSALIGDRLEVTAWLLIVGIIFSLVITVPLAIVTAMRRDGPVDHAVRVGGVLGLSMPAFWIGVMLILLVALPTGWFPVGGFGETTSEHVRSIFLPALTLAIGMSPILIRSLRASAITVLDSDVVATGRSLGLSNRRLIRRFVLRNAAATTVTLLALEIGFLLFGAASVVCRPYLPGLVAWCDLPAPDS